MAYTHELILCIVNSGFSDAVMDAAREFGARGGTVLNARGTANPTAEKLFGITVQPEKEMVMILVDSEIKEDILHALYNAVGLNTPGQGIAFSLPVEDVVGLGKSVIAKPEEKSVEKTETVEAPSENVEKEAEAVEAPAENVEITEENVETEENSDEVIRSRT